MEPGSNLLGVGVEVSDFHSPTSPAGGVTAAHLIPLPEIELSPLEGRQSKSIRKSPVAITSPSMPTSSHVALPPGPARGPDTYRKQDKAPARFWAQRRGDMGTEAQKLRDFIAQPFLVMIRGS